MVCDFLSPATLSFHLFSSCERMQISATPMNIANCEFSLVFQVCFIGKAQLFWSMVDSFHIALFKENLVELSA